jgi:hypothetical protein
MKLIRRLKKKKSTETQSPTTAPVVGASTSTTEPTNDNFTRIDAIQNAGKLFEVLESVSEASDLLSPLKAICGVLRIATDMALVGKLPFSSTILTNVFLVASLQEWPGSARFGQ